jgi:hypothetical protein
MKNHQKPLQLTATLTFALLTLILGLLTNAFAMTAPSHEIVAGKPEPTDKHADNIDTHKTDHNDTKISTEPCPNESDNKDNNEDATNNNESDHPHQ